MRLATRRSLKTVQGVTPALRPRFPSRDSSVPLNASGQGSWNTPVGEYFDGTAGFPAAVQTGLTKVLGRPVREDNCRLSSFPVMMLNGRPEPNSTSGAIVQLLKNLLPKPSPPGFPD